MSRGRQRAFLLASGLVVLGFVACTLNPQPLPPLDPEAVPGNDASFSPTVDAGSRGDDEAPAQDAGLSPPGEDADAGRDAGDAGDVGDAGDAGDAGDDD